MSVGRVMCSARALVVRGAMALVVSDMSVPGAVPVRGATGLGVGIRSLAAVVGMWASAGRTGWPSPSRCVVQLA